MALLLLIVHCYNFAYCLLFIVFAVYFVYYCYIFCYVNLIPTYFRSGQIIPTYWNYLTEIQFIPTYFRSDQIIPTYWNYLTEIQFISEADKLFQLIGNI